MKKVLIGSLPLNSRFRLIPRNGGVYRVVSVTEDHVLAIRNSKNMISFSRNYHVFV